MFITEIKVIKSWIESWWTIIRLDLTRAEKSQDNECRSKSCCKIYFWIRANDELAIWPSVNSLSSEELALFALLKKWIMLSKITRS